MTSFPKLLLRGEFRSFAVSVADVSLVSIYSNIFLVLILKLLNFLYELLYR
jgi:hypothetical protein